MRRACVTSAVLALLTVPALAGNFHGEVDFENKPECANLPTDIIIRTSGTVAEIQLGTESRGQIAIDPRNGNFLGKETDSRLTIAGSVTNGALADGFHANCIGRFKAAEQN